MKWNQQKLYVKYFFCSFLVCVLLILSPMSLIGSFASSTESGAITIQEQWANNVYNNFQTLLQDSLKVSVPKSESDQIWNNYIDHCYSIWNLNENDLQSHYGHFRDYVGSQFEMEKNSDNTYNYNMSEDAYTFIQDSYNTYVSENPLSFKKCYLYSYNFLNPNSFSTYQQYASTKEYLKNGGDRYSVIVILQGNVLISQYLKQDMNLAFIGTTNQGSFTNVTPYVNWQTLGQYILPPAVSINSGGVVTEISNTNWYGYANIKNTPTPNGTNKIIMSPNEKNEMVYVFETLAAYKNYNSGNPLPYYTMSGYTGVIEPTGYQVPNTNNSYESIVNNIQSGWTAQEVLELVDRIMSQGTGSGGSSSGNGDDGWLDLGIFGEIGKAIAKVIGAIITAIASIFEEIIGIVTQVSETLLQGVIFEFLSAFIGWLPDEIIALLTALFSVAVLFALVKLIREAF